MSPSKPNKPDIVFLASRINTFIDVVQDPQGFFNRVLDGMPPKSLDLMINAVSLYLLVDCYLRGRGLKIHPRSSTQDEAMETLVAMMQAVDEEVAARPYMYPKLSGVMGRGQAAVELDSILQSFSLWAEEDELRI